MESLHLCASKLLRQEHGDWSFTIGESGTWWNMTSRSGICFGQDNMKCEDPGHKESRPSTPPAPRSMRRMVSSRSIRSDMSVSSSGSTFLGQLADDEDDDWWRRWVDDPFWFVSAAEDAGGWWQCLSGLIEGWDAKTFSINFSFCFNCGFAMPCLLFDILVVASPLSWRFVRESSCATETTLITVSDYI